MGEIFKTLGTAGIGHGTCRIIHCGGVTAIHDLFWPDRWDLPRKNDRNQGTIQQYNTYIYILPGSYWYLPIYTVTIDWNKLGNLLTHNASGRPLQCQDAPQLVSSGTAPFHWCFDPKGVRRARRNKTQAPRDRTRTPSNSWCIRSSKSSRNTRQELCTG